MTVNSHTLTFLLILGFWSVVTESLLITATNTNQDGSFSENSKVVLTCTINPYTGSQTWKVDSVAVSDCGIAGCLANSSNPGSFSFTNDLVNGIFAFSIDEINSFYHKSQVECLDGSGSDTYTIIVIGPIVITCSHSDGALRIYEIYIIGIFVLAFLSINVTIGGLTSCKSFLEGKNNKSKQMLLDHFRVYLFVAFIIDCIRAYQAKTKFPICNKHEWKWICLKCKSYLCKKCDMAINVKHKTEKDKRDAKMKKNGNREITTETDEAKCQRCNQEKIGFLCTEQNCRLKLCRSCNVVHNCEHKTRMRIRDYRNLKLGKGNACLILFCCIPGFSFFIVFFLALLYCTKCIKQPGSFKCIVLIFSIFSVVCLHPLILLRLVFEECDEDLAPIWWHYVIPIIGCIFVLPFPLICVLSHIMLSQGFHCDDCRLKSKVFGYCTGCFKYLCRDCLHRNHKQPGHLVLKHHDELGKDHGIKSYCLECGDYIRDLTMHMGHPYLVTEDDDNLINSNTKAKNRCSTCKQKICEHKNQLIDVAKLNLLIRRLELSSHENTTKSPEMKHCDECNNKNVCLECSGVKNVLLSNVPLFDSIGEKAEEKTCMENVTFFCTTCHTRKCSGCIGCQQDHVLYKNVDPNKFADETNDNVKHCKVCQAKGKFCLTCETFVQSSKSHESHFLLMAIKSDHDSGNKQNHTVCNANVLHYCRTCGKFITAKGAGKHEGHDILVAFVPETEKKITINSGTGKANVIYFCATCNDIVNWTTAKSHNAHNKDHRIFMTLNPDNDQSHASYEGKMRKYCCQCKTFIDSKCPDDCTEHKVIDAFETYAEYNQTIHCKKCKANVISFCFNCKMKVDAKSAAGHKDHDVLMTLKPENCNGGYGDVFSCKTKVIHYCHGCKEFENSDCKNGHDLLKVLALDGAMANHDIPCKICRVNVMRFCPSCKKDVCLRCVNKTHEHKLLKPLQQDYGNFIFRNDPFVCKCTKKNVDCFSAKEEMFLCSNCFLKDGTQNITITNTNKKCVVCKDINDKHGATVFCLICNHYMCSECFEWHLEFDKNLDPADKFLISTNTTVKREQELSKLEIFKIICASFPVLGIVAIIIIQCCKDNKVCSAGKDVEGGEQQQEHAMTDITGNQS